MIQGLRDTKENKMAIKETEMKTAFEIMERNHKTGESNNVDVVTAKTKSEAKSIWHLRTGQYDTSEFSYWVKYPVCR